MCRPSMYPKDYTNAYLPSMYQYILTGSPKYQLVSYFRLCQFRPKTYNLPWSWFTLDLNPSSCEISALMKSMKVTSTNFVAAFLAKVGINKTKTIYFWLEKGLFISWQLITITCLGLSKVDRALQLNVLNKTLI